MKKVFEIIVIHAFVWSAMALFAAPSFGAVKPGDPVHILSMKRYVFHFKVDKELIGATVEILDECKTLVCQETASRVRNIVDFFELPAGNYTIRIKKGSKEFVFDYVNKE